MTSRRAYLLQAASDLHFYIGGQTLDDTAYALGGIVQHFEQPLHTALYERQHERDVARDLAAALEAQTAAVAELHAGFDYGVGEEHHGRLCRECSVEWPCATARAVGADVLRDDIFADLTLPDGEPF